MISKLKKSNELFIGLFAFLLLAILYWGINFLKGENIFSNKRFFYAVYENVDGLTISRPVTVNGFRVGQVSNIKFNSSKNSNLIVEVAIEEDITFSTNSMLEIYDSDIMGSKSLELKMIHGNQIALSGDTLGGAIATGLTGEFTEQFGSMKVGLDQLIISFDQVLKQVENLSMTANRLILTNEEKVSQSLQNIEEISRLLEHRTQTIDNILLNISELSDSLITIQFTTISDNMVSLSEQLDILLTNINDESGTMGQLIYNDSIYNELSNTLNSMDELLIDIKSNPKKYINLSIWGGDKKSSK